MGLKKVTQEEYLLKTIDDTIKALQLQRAEIVASQPQPEFQDLPAIFIGRGGKVLPIKGRKQG